MAAETHGVLTTRQLYVCGWSDTMIHDAVQRGQLYRAFTRVFSVGTPITTAYQRAMAVSLATKGLISHHWARWLFGLGRLPRHAPDVTVVTNRRDREGMTLHRTRTKPIPDASNGVPCTRPERMVIDCAPDLTLQDLRRLVNDVQIKRLVTFPTLKAAVEAAPGRDTRALRALLAEDQHGATRSLLEDLLSELSNERGLPKPTLNAIVDGFEVDCSYYDGAIIVEADGYDFHGTKIAFENDREKWLALEANGRRVLPVSYRQLTELRDRTADELEAIIRRPVPVSSSATPSPATSPTGAPVYGSAPAASG